MCSSCICQGYFAVRRKPQTVARRGDAAVRLDVRPHGVVLARPLGTAVLVAAAGGGLVALGWPVSPLGAVAVCVAAFLALRAVWRWERTRVVVTGDELRVETGTVRRRSAAVALSRVGAVEVEQSVLGRLLGYGTLVAGDLEVAHVARPRAVARLLR
jgi:membrane protein YdbS with pleckstrin-like domain